MEVIKQMKLQLKIIQALCLQELLFLIKIKWLASLLGMNSICHLMCTNMFESSIISVPSPFNKNQIMDLSVQTCRNTQNDVSLVNGSPYINVDVSLRALVASSEYGLDLTNRNNVDLIEKYASSYIKNKILDYLYTTSKNYHTDIAGFGKFLAYNYLTVDEYEKLNWPHLYSDSFFNVNVDIDVVNSYLLVQN